MSGNGNGTVVTTQLRLGVLALLLALVGGAMSVLHYVPAASLWLNENGLTMPRVRPVHTTFASLWIFGVGIAVVYDWISRCSSPLTRAELWRFRAHTLLWIVAGAGILVTLLGGWFSGREYLEYHPLWSVPLLLGWLLFGWTFLRRALPGFWQRPVYVYMWTVGICLFVVAFAEGHAWLLAPVAEQPLRDLQIQWKSCGTLVGSFNFLVYGSLAYLGERISGDSRYGHSRLAFLLFGVGCLNSFTNYVHHIYHVPQDDAAKWIAFVVSMLEVVILWKYVADIAKARGKAPRDPTLRFVVATRNWTACNLLLAILISVPSLNSVIHGTYVVTAHAMGTEIGIDSMALFAAVTWLLTQQYAQDPVALRRIAPPTVALHLRFLNFAAGGLVAWLLAVGLTSGWRRLHGQAPPDWVVGGKVVFPLLGGCLALALLVLVWRWGRVLWAGPGAAVVVREPKGVEA
jgi:nitric oxide reductase subunit B